MPFATHTHTQRDRYEPMYTRSVGVRLNAVYNNDTLVGYTGRRLGVRNAKAESDAITILQTCYYITTTTTTTTCSTIATTRENNRS